MRGVFTPFFIFSLVFPAKKAIKGTLLKNSLIFFGEDHVFMGIEIT
jgi:hypothetical protein